MAGFQYTKKEMDKKQLSLDDPIDTLKGVGPATQSALERLGISTVLNLIEYLPYRTEDRSQVTEITHLQPGVDCVIEVTVKNVSSRRSKRGILIIQAAVVDGSGKVPAVWFNQRYLLGQLKVGDSYYLYGTKKIIPSIGNPFIVKAIIDRPEIVPFYHATKGLTQAAFYRLIFQLEEYFKLISNILPDKYTSVFAPRRELLKTVHRQPNEDILNQVTELLAYEELTILALVILINKAPEQKINRIKIDLDILKKIVSDLPFELTDGQRKAAWEIITDIGQPRTMRRLLYGEVGSGKTIVSALAAAAVVSFGGQVAILCPTTTLANQQYKSLKKIFEKIDVSCSLMISDSKDKNYQLSSIVIGTQALLQKNIRLKNLRLIVIDEQHRFGVKDRQYLFNNFPDAHLLMMTATPIPRSLAQTIFGGLKITYLLEKPHHQKEIKTYVFTDKNRKDVEAEINKRLSLCQPGYVICPLIEAGGISELALFGNERKTVEQESKRLAKEFSGSKVATLHGRLANAEKQQILADFRDGKIDILVATTVVEVGIDNPRATWMLIEEADRFGLNQLHQLRGRIGRGDKESICFMSDSGTSEFGKKRLEVIQKTTDGLELAEFDLSLRGPGEIIGYEQSGLPRLRYVTWQDIGKIKASFATAKKILDEGLAKYPELKQRVKRLSDDPTFG